MATLTTRPKLSSENDSAKDGNIREPAATNSDRRIWQVAGRCREIFRLMHVAQDHIVAGGEVPDLLEQVDGEITSFIADGAYYGEPVCHCCVPAERHAISATIQRAAR